MQENKFSTETESLRLEGTSGSHVVQSPLLMQGPLPRLATQGPVQMAPEHPQRWRLHNLSGQPVPMSSHPHTQKVSPDVLTEPPVFHFMPFLLSLGTHENSPSLASLHPLLRHLDTLMRSPSAFSSPDSTVPAPSAVPCRRDAPSLLWPFV